MTVSILKGDCREVLRTLPDESVHCVVTSPPYWGLRDYGVDGQIGLEPTFEQFIDKMVEVFQEVRRVLRADGTCWVNLGDSYNTGTTSGRNPTTAGKHGYWENPAIANRINANQMGLKPKDLVGIPWRVAFALQANGWWLRQDIIWAKPNPMPESVTDRCTKAHEYIFLLSKSERYYYDAEAIKEPALWPNGANSPESIKSPYGQSFTRNAPAVKESRKTKIPGGWDRCAGGHGTIHRDGRTSAEYQQAEIKPNRNKRSVWTVSTTPFGEAHFATFPPALIEPCILAGCPKGGTVLDPFGGAGTTGLVADRLGRNAVLIELNPEYADMAERRLRNDAGLFADVAQTSKERPEDHEYLPVLL